MPPQNPRNLRADEPAMEDVMATIKTTRRACLIALLCQPLLVRTATAQRAIPQMIVSKDPNCGCCGEWVAYLQANGFSVTTRDSSNLDTVRASLGVPRDLASCHTAEIGGYVVEGHVPYPSILRLLAEKPRATGIAVPGMPQSSPGMDTPGARDIYEVILFGPSGRRRYARYQGRREL